MRAGGRTTTARPHPAPTSAPPRRHAAGDVGSLGVWTLAWPTIVSNLLYSAAGFIDIKIVGALGPSAVAALTTGLRVFFAMQAVLIAVTAGTTALVARAWGAGDHEEAAEVTRLSLWLCLALTLGVTVPVVIWAERFAGIFRLDAATIAQAAAFTRWLSVFYAAFAVNLVLGAALRATGDAVTPLWTGALANGVAVAVAYVLVYGKLGLPALGVTGAAFGHAAGWIAGAIAILWLWLRGKVRLGVGGRSAFSFERTRRLLAIGYPAAMEQVAWQSGFILFLWIVALYGTAPYAAYGIGVNILSFSFLVGFGFSVAASTLVGQRLGAGDPEGAAHGGWRAMRLAIAAMLAFAAVIITAAEPLARFLIDDPEVVRLTVVFIHVLGSVQALMAIEYALGGALRGAGDTRFPFLTVVTGLFGVRLPLAAGFYWLGWSPEWIFAALIGDYIVKATMLSLRFRSGRWKTALVRVGA
jgi:putative MATE family efflux protein